MDIEIILTDIDGVWTDGGMYYDQEHNELKKFHTYDSAGVLFAKRLNIPIVIITGEETEIVTRRAMKLKIDYLYQGVKDKLELAKQISKKLSIPLSKMAYIGDDINDLELLENIGFSATPSSAPLYIQENVDYITQKKGGEGAFREFVEYLIKNKLRLELPLKDTSTLTQ